MGSEEKGNLPIHIVTSPWRLLSLLQKRKRSTNLPYYYFISKCAQVIAANGSQNKENEKWDISTSKFHNANVIYFQISAAIYFLSHIKGIANASLIKCFVDGEFVVGRTYYLNCEL